MLEWLIPVIICLLYAVSCTFLGLIVLKWLKKYTQDHEQHPAYFRLANAFLTGLGILTCVLLFLGLSKQFSQHILIALLCLILIYGIFFLSPDLRKFFSDIFSDLFSFTYPEKPLMLKIVFTLTIVLLFIEGIHALVFQPLGDAAAYYMVLPKLIASSQYIALLPGYEAFTQISLFGELHYAALISLGTPLAAKFFVWFIFLIAVLVLFQIGKKVGLGLYGKCILLAIFLTSSALTGIIFGGTVDWFAAAFGLAAFFWALEFSQNDRNSFLIFAGFFSGIAIIAKLSYIYTFLPGVVILIYWKYISKFSFSIKTLNILNKQNIRSVMKTGVIFGCSVFIAVLLNIIKNYLLFNQPFAPFISTSYPTGVSQIWYTQENAIWIIITLPFALVFGQYPMQGGNISPLFLALVPLLFLITTKESIEKTNFNKIAFCSILCVIISIIVTPYVFAPRYLLVPLILLMLIPAKAAEYCIINSSKNPIIAKLILLFTVLLLLATLVNSSYGIYSTLKQGECDIIGPICHASQMINNQANNDDRIYFLGYYSYWLNDNLLTNLSTTKEREYVQKALQSPDDRVEYLHNKKFQYIFSDGSFANVSQNYSTENNSQNLKMSRVFEEGNVIVFKINNSA